MKTIIKRINNGMAAGVLALSAVLGTVVLPQPASALSGNGSAENPWQLSTCTQLQSIGYEWGEWEAAGSGDAYVLTGDIDCNGVAFNSISFGEGGDAFHGVFDGAGHTISNLSISALGAENLGLFSRIDGGTVRDLTLANVSVEGQLQNMGALAGFTYNATIENVHVTSGTVGVIGSGAEAESIGGLVGQSRGSTYTEVSANATIDGNMAAYNLGGLIGDSADDDIQQAAAYGNVSGGGYLGGLIGYAFDSTIYWVHAKGNVVGSGASIGGLVGGLEDGTVASGYARGSVSGSNNVGGLIGFLYNNFSVSFSYSTGHVTVVPDNDAGGLIGQISSEGGYLDETNFWDVQSSGFATNHGNYPVGETTANMKTMSTFTNAGWDFTDEPIWGLTSTFNDGYPCHSWEEGCETSGGNNNGNNGSGQPEIDGNVANLTTATGAKQVTLTVDDSCTLSDVSALNAANTAVKDAAYSYATSFVKFTATGCDANTAHVQLLYHDISPDNLAVRKYNPGSNAYFTIAGATMTKVGNDTLVTYTITDNGDLDTNTATGVITDPVGLGSLIVGVPNTGLGGVR